jgi:hypothetical protein
MHSAGAPLSDIAPLYKSDLKKPLIAAAGLRPCDVNTIRVSEALAYLAANVMFPI